MASDSAREIEQEIRRQIVVQGEPELRRAIRDYGRELKAEAISISPPPTGEPPHFRDSWEFRLRSLRGRLPSGRLSNKSRLTNIVEGGTSEFERPQGGSSPAWEIFHRLAFQHGGTVDGVGGDDDEL